MRFWIILILVFVGATFGVWHAFSGITGIGKSKDDVVESSPVADRSFSGASDDDDDDPFSPSSLGNSEPLQILPIARNSVRFNHRPVPSSDQLALLTQGSTGGSSRPDVIERRVVAVADVATNTVLLYGDLLEVERLADALRSMDQVIASCHLKTWVVFVRGDKNKGFDLVSEIVSSGDFSGFAAALGGGVFSAAAGIDKLQFNLTASMSEGLIEIVDQPYMQLLHGTESRISTVDEIAIPSTTTNQGVVETSIDFRRVGLSFSVTPFFLSNDRVRLNVVQENGVIGATRQISGNDIPELSTQNLTTSAELRLGQVLVLGGVESSQKEKRRGWFTKSDSRTLGHLYIVAAVYSTIPKAERVIKLEGDFGVDSPVDGDSLLPMK